MQAVSKPRQAFKIGFIVIGGALLLAGCNVLKLGQSTDDKAITTEIQAKLFDDPVLKLRDIHVTSEQGSVTLTGTVSTELEKAAVERIASQADGVKRVVDQLAVSSAPAAEPAATAQATPTAEARPPVSAAPTSVRHERARASGRAHQRASSNYVETRADVASVDQDSAQEAAANPPAMPTPAASAPVAPAAPAPAAPAPTAAAPLSEPVAKPPEQITIPSGTVFSVRMIDSIDSTQSQAGSEFAATIDAPVVVGDRVVIPRNSDARVRLVQATSAGRMSGRSELKVELTSVRIGGQTYQLQTGYYEQAGASRSTRTAETVGGGAVLGALLGAIAGRGRGAAIGSVAGAGAGTAVEAGTHGQQVKIPSETKLSFTLKSPVTVTVNPAT